MAEQLGSDDAYDRCDDYGPRRRQGTGAASARGADAGGDHLHLHVEDSCGGRAASA